MDVVTHKQLSPAKINLMLRVLKQRTDGYHELQTCFQLLNWGDEITFTAAESGNECEIEIAGFVELHKADNLIYQAAQLLKPMASTPSSWLVKVNKKIPMGAGLGGGSSNAAVVLKFLNEQWQCGLSQSELQQKSVSLGADVPVFIAQQSALAGGVGEQLLPMSFATPYILLLFPETAINTAALFSRKELNRKQTPLQLDYIHEPSFWINDFMPVVLNLYPELNALYQQLKPHIPLRLSGTGSTLFALFNEHDGAKAAKILADKYCEAVLVKPLLSA